MAGGKYRSQYSNAHAIENNFGKRFKLVNNVAFGKMNENLRNCINVEVANKQEIGLKRAAKPTIKPSYTALIQSRTNT